MALLNILHVENSFLKISIHKQLLVLILPKANGRKPFCSFIACLLTDMINMEQTSFAVYYVQNTNLNDVDSDV